MRRKDSEKGFVLPVTLLLLICLLLCSSLVLAGAADSAQAAGNEVQQYRSRLMARSGWNLAMGALASGNFATGDTFTFTGTAGEQGTAAITAEADNIFEISATGQGGGYTTCITGKVEVLWPENTEESSAEVSEENAEADVHNPQEGEVIPQLRLLSRRIDG